MARASGWTVRAILRSLVWLVWSSKESVLDLTGIFKSMEVLSREVVWSDQIWGCTLVATRKEQGAALGGGSPEGSVQDPGCDLNRAEVTGCPEQT